MSGTLLAFLLFLVFAIGGAVGASLVLLCTRSILLDITKELSIGLAAELSRSLSQAWHGELCKHLKLHGLPDAQQYAAAIAKLVVKEFNQQVVQ